MSVDELAVMDGDKCLLQAYCVFGTGDDGKTSGDTGWTGDSGERNKEIVIVYSCTLRNPDSNRIIEKEKEMITM